MNYLEEYKKIFNNEKFIRHNKKISLTDYSYFDGFNIQILIEKILLEINDKNSINLLDYGCGTSKAWHESAIGLKRQNLFEIFGDKIREFCRYDKRNPKFVKRPSSKFDIIICANVLEHFPEHELSNIFNDLEEFSTEDTVIFYLINTGPSKNFFLDGTNMHLNQKSPSEWISLITKFNKCRSSITIDENF